MSFTVNQGYSLDFIKLWLICAYNYFESARDDNLSSDSEYRFNAASLGSAFMKDWIVFDISVNPLIVLI